MENLKTTMRCINAVPVTVIAGDDGKVTDLICDIMKPVKQSVLIPNGSTPTPLTVKDIETLYLKGKKRKLICVKLNALAPTSDKPTGERSPFWKYAAAVTELTALAEAYGVKIIAILPTEKRSVCRGVYFRIPEETKSKVRVTALEQMSTEIWWLNIEAGKDVGRYIAYEYDQNTWCFKEKE